MSNTIPDLLYKTSRRLGQCAKAVAAHQTRGSLAATQIEQIIGFGIASDWARWARLLESVKYSAQRRSTSNKELGLTELIRFTFMWTGANALFARPAIIRALSPSCGANAPELERFRVLYHSSRLSSAQQRHFESNLHSMLSSPVHVEGFPWPALNNPPTLLEVIYFKYMVDREQRMGLGRKLLRAAQTGSYTELDLPTLIYATRNWNIHGVLLSSSFRGQRKKFSAWVGLINLALATVLEGTAEALEAAV